MSIEAAISTRFSTLASGRVYALTPPKSTATPCIVYTVVSRTRLYTHSGISKLNRYRVQMSCYATSYADAKSLADSVTALMDTWHESATDIDGAILDNEADLYEKDTGLYHIPRDYFIWYQNP